MSRSSATGTRALDVPATPGTPLRDASLTRGADVLSQAPLGTTAAARDRLVLVDTSLSSSLVTQFFAQVYGITSPLTGVSSWSDVEREVRACSSIGELLLFSHAVYSAASIGGVQKTPSQIADLLAPVMPPTATLRFEGCVLGHALDGLHDLALRLRIGQVQAWTFWHYLDWWNPFPTGDPAAALAKFSPLAVVAEPYLPASADGARTISVAVQEASFSANALSLAAEYFIEVLGTHAKPNFAAAVQQGLLTASAHRPRGSAEYRLIDSAGSQAALDALNNSTRPPFARVVMTPWR